MWPDELGEKMPSGKKVENLVEVLKAVGSTSGIGTILLESRTQTVESGLKRAGIVEAHVLDDTLHLGGTEIAVPDVKLPRLLTVASENGIEDVLYEPVDGPLSHYNAWTGLATPCLRLGGHEGDLAFRPEFAMPFRGRELTWDRLARFHSKGRG